MSLPSAVTVGSLGFVLIAGVGLAAATAETVNHSPSRQSAAAPSTTRVAHTPSASENPPALPTAPTRTVHKRAGARAHPDAAPNVLVEVYNNTTMTGLAAQKATMLEGAGWNVAATANWYGNIPADTVYYPPHLRAAAKKLAHALHIARLRPAVAPMQFDRLTVILATG